MSFTYLQEQGAESSAATFSDIPAFVLSRLNLTAARSCSSGNATDAWRGSQSGTTFAPSTGDRGEDLLTLCVAGSHARTFPQQDAAPASPASGRDSGRKWPASLAKYDPDTCSWRTHQYSLRGDLELFSETWPRWGLMRGGECWERMPLDFHITEPDCGWLPTPSGVNGGRNHTMGRVDEWGGSSNPLRGTELGKALSPRFEEIVMGWPTDWTALTPYETDKFQQWQHSHGGHLANEQAKSGGGQ